MTGTKKSGKRVGVVTKVFMLAVIRPDGGGEDVHAQEVVIPPPGSRVSFRDVEGEAFVTDLEEYP
jgi:hypothetical protein